MPPVPHGRPLPCLSPRWAFGLHAVVFSPARPRSRAGLPRGHDPAAARSRPDNFTGNFMGGFPGAGLPAAPAASNPPEFTAFRNGFHARRRDQALGLASLAVRGVQNPGSGNFRQPDTVLKIPAVSLKPQPNTLKQPGLAARGRTWRAAARPPTPHARLGRACTANASQGAPPYRCAPGRTPAWVDARKAVIQHGPYSVGVTGMPGHTGADAAVLLGELTHEDRCVARW